MKETEKPAELTDQAAEAVSGGIHLENPRPVYVPVPPRPKPKEEDRDA